MNNNNNNYGGKKGTPVRMQKAKQRLLKKELQAELRAAAGLPAQGKGRGKRNRQAKRAGAQNQKAAAAAYATGQSSGEAKIFRNSVDSCRIVHRELIASVVGTVAFTVAQSFALNPGMVASFPWLANEAAGWERYRFNRLRFCYYTRTGSNIPGSVMLAPDYDAADAAPVGEQIASSYEDTEEDAPWKDIVCELPSKELMGDMKEKTIRSGALAANQDIKTYDAGNLHLCTVDGTAVSWGKLWVEYDVTLFTPQVPAGGFAAAGTLQGALAASMGAAAPFGTASVATGGVVITSGGLTLVTLSNVQIGQEIEVSFACTGTVITAMALGTLTGLTLKNTLFAGFDAAATHGAAISTYTVTALNPSFAVTMTSATVTQSFLVVTVLSPIPAL